MSFEVRPVEPAERAAWDEFVEASNEGTIFHRLDFLAYHGERFAGREHPLVFRKGEALHAVLPLALLEEDGRRVARSPYGASVGGPCTRKALRWHECHALLDDLLAYLGDAGADELVLTLPVQPCYRDYSETLRYALELRGARLGRRLLCSVADLRRGDGDATGILSTRARRGLRKAEKAGVRTALRADLDDFWQVMETTFAKHGSRPTHTREEFGWLASHLPDRVWANVAYVEGEPAAGVGCFRVNARLEAAFYLCSDPRHQPSQALTRLLVETFAAARVAGVRWFDLGTTYRREGFEFKENFATRGFLRESYRLRVAEAARLPWTDAVETHLREPVFRDD